MKPLLKNSYNSKKKTIKAEDNKNYRNHKQLSDVHHSYDEMTTGARCQLLPDA